MNTVHFHTFYLNDIVRQRYLWSQVVGCIPSQSGSHSLPFLSSHLFFPCFDTLIFTICPVRPITDTLHFYASAAWANRAYSCCRQTTLSLVPWLTCATKRACVRNQESTSQANHFNKHGPTALNGSVLCFIWFNVPFFTDCLLDVMPLRHAGGTDY